MQNFTNVPSSSRQDFDQEDLILMTKEEAEKDLQRYLQEHECNLIQDSDLRSFYTKDDPNFPQLDDFELPPDENEMLESADGIKQAEALFKMMKPT